MDLLRSTHLVVHTPAPVNRAKDDANDVAFTFGR
jgi:hypothetical protein